MREIELRILGALAGALPFVLTAGQAAEAQTCMTAPTPTPMPTQPPSPDLADRIAGVQREFCDAIARARTPEEVQHVTDQLANNLTFAASIAELNRQKQAELAKAQANVNMDEQILAQKRAAFQEQIDSQIRTDQQAMADARAKAAAVEANGVNGGPSLSAIDQHIQENTALVNQGVNPLERRQAQQELALWQAKRNELMAAKAEYASAYANAANDISQQQARRSAAFERANPQFTRQVEGHRYALQEAQQEASRSNDSVQRNAPYLQGYQSLADTVTKCASQRVAQIGGGTPPPPYAPQASPAPSPQTAPPPP